MPDAVLIAGPNGAGKTTFARQFLRLRYPAMIFLNADEIQHEDPRFDHPVAAGRELLRRLDALEASRSSFAVESTLSSTAYSKRLAKWSALGYRTTLHFIELPSAEYATGASGRGSRQVDMECPKRTSGGDSAGGFTYSAAFSSRCRIDGTIGSVIREGFALSTKPGDDSDERELEILLEAARRATWDALHGPRYLRSGRFTPVPEEEEETPEGTAEQGNAPDGDPRRR